MIDERKEELAALGAFGLLEGTQREQFLAEASRDAFNERLRERGYPAITTEIESAPTHPFYYAEDCHQQYLNKNPMGYCGLGGTGVSCPIGLDVPAQTGALAPG